MSEDKYTKIDKHINKLSKSKDIATLYNEDLVNWSGPQNPSDDHPYYSNYIAEKLFETHDIDNLFSKIEGSKRNNYFVGEHNGVIENFTKRKEEIFAKSLLSHDIQNLGTIIDYQMPLNGKQTDHFGKIDLVSLHADANTAYIIELKMNLVDYDVETVLRAALEIETYYNALIKNQQHFIKYIEAKIEERYSNKTHPFQSINTDKIGIRKAVLFAYDDESGLPKELKEENIGYYQSLKKLLVHLGIYVYVMPYRYPVQKY